MNGARKGQRLIEEIEQRNDDNNQEETELTKMVKTLREQEEDKEVLRGIERYLEGKTLREDI